MDEWVPCGLGVCAAEDGHAGTCAEASGWDEKPIRVQLSRRKGWRKPPNTVVVARPSKWGNPWRVTREQCTTHDDLCWVVRRDGLGDHFSTQERAHEYAVEVFREQLMHGLLPALEAHLPELAGKNLACWCARLPCHADVLLELANGPGATHP